MAAQTASQIQRRSWRPSVYSMVLDFGPFWIPVSYVNGETQVDKTRAVCWHFLVKISYGLRFFFSFFINGIAFLHCTKNVSNCFFSVHYTPTVFVLLLKMAGAEFTFPLSTALPIQVILNLDKPDLFMKYFSLTSMLSQYYLGNKVWKQNRELKPTITYFTPNLCRSLWWDKICFTEIKFLQPVNRFPLSSQITWMTIFWIKTIKFWSTDTKKNA